MSKKDVLLIALLLCSQVRGMDSLFIVASVGVATGSWFYFRSYRYHERKKFVCRLQNKIAETHNLITTRTLQYGLVDKGLKDFDFDWSLHISDLTPHPATSTFFGHQHRQDSKAYANYLAEASAHTRKTELATIAELCQHTSEAYCRGQYDGRIVVSLMAMQNSIKSHIDLLQIQESNTIHQ